ncbi:hypothetical protein H0H87_003331 [Tephrocybe sp. NHM501043]|nr:hypothetical protein H0H87_003331 [Tephrocybe sp. NHM501043]
MAFSVAHIHDSFLDPGLIPEIRGVTRQDTQFPAQEQVGGDSKIPSIIYYDEEGKIRAVGAEALKEDLEMMVEEEGWTKVEWFKLHLRPSSHANAHLTRALPPLPENKTVIEVLSDFLEYLYKCARRYIEETHANGAHLWASLEKNIEFVLTHPNGWEGPQQSQMRRAAIRAGLVPDTLAGRSHLLEGSKFSDDVDDIARCFDITTKLRFRNAKEPQYIKFGSARDKDLSLGIRGGQLKLQGYHQFRFNHNSY